jgi:PAS domain S-box-containing protein
MKIWALESLTLLAALGLWFWAWRQHRRSGQLRAVLDCLDLGVLLLDADDRVLQWNPRLERLRGIAPGAITARMGFAEYLSIAQRIRQPSERDAGPAPVYWHSRLQPGEQLLRDAKFENGPTLQIAATRLDDGKCLLCYRDVGPIKQSQLAFRDLATRLAATLDNVLDAIITFNDLGIIDSFSAGAEQMFGYSSAEVIGQNVKMLMADAHSVLHDGYLSAYRRTGVPRIMRKRREVQARRKNGSDFPIELGVSEMRVHGRQLFIGIIRDITERQRIERMQQDFVATVSHELRTPLTSIVGSVDLVLALPGEALGAKSRRLLDIASQNGRRLQRLIGDILDAARSNVESLELSIEPQSLGQVMKLTVDSNQSYAARFAVRLVAEPIDEDVIAQIDADRLQQVLSNLVSNAIKFSPAGATVSVRLIRDGNFAQLEVSDFGPGIPDHFRPHVFEKFRQADSSDARAKSGTGLGLYIARNLVERMGGQIGFESEAGRGTTFRVRLPLHGRGTLRTPVAADLPRAVGQQ